MKKILALVMAAALALGVCTTAFAADNKAKALTFGSSSIYTLDDKTMTEVKSSDLVPGKTYYYHLAKADEKGQPIAPVTKLSDLDNYRISYSADEGKNMVGSIKFTVQSINKIVGEQPQGFAAGKNAFIAVALKDNFVLENQDINLSMTLSGKNDAQLFGYADSGLVRPDITGERDALSFVHTAGYPTSDVSNGYFTVQDGMVLSFGDDADDVILCFDDDVEVAGNMKGQKDIFVRISSSNSAIEDKYPDATLRFFDGDKDAFKRDVKVTVPYASNDSAKAPFLYEVASNGALTKMKDAKYNEELGAFQFSAKTLGNYLISDTELKSVVDSDSKDDTTKPKPEQGGSTGTGGEKNPGTGANDFVGVALALAAISITGLIAAKAKK